LGNALAIFYQLDFARLDLWGNTLAEASRKENKKRLSLENNVMFYENFKD
jgi:hypothetical protein